MTVKQKLELKLSEQRQKLNELAGLDKLTEEQLAEMRALQSEHAATEVQFRAAVAAEPAEIRLSGDGLTAEQRARAELRSRVSLGRYVQAAAGSRGVDGAELEFCQSLNMTSDQLPLELLAPEMRATTDASNVERNRRWIDRLFAESQARYAGVSFDSVPAGEATYTVTSAGGSAVQRAKTEAVTDSTWTIGTTTLKPKRLTVTYSYSVEDAARLPGLSDALARDMRAALSESMDAAVFNGDTGATGTDADITGLFDVSGTTAKTLTQANKVKWPETVQTFASLLDGKAAGRLEDLRCVFSVPYNALLVGTSANANLNESLAQVMRGNGLQWRSRADIDDGTANGDKLAIVGLSGGIGGTAVAAVWSNATLVRDIYTGAKKGEVSLTLTSLWDFAVPRASNWAKVSAVA